MGINTGVRFLARVMREDHALRRAASKMPKPVPWDWAQPRLMPLLAQPCFDLPGSERIRAVAPVGCAIEFGLDLGGHFPIVDRIVAERWECTIDQLRDAAMSNLERRAAAVLPSAIRHAAMSGRAFRVLRRPNGFASSVLLVPHHLKRLFGDNDQILAAPGRHTLLSFSVEAPTRAVAEIVVDIEEGEVAPLFLSPFVLSEGELMWDVDDEDLPDGC